MGAICTYCEKDMLGSGVDTCEWSAEHGVDFPDGTNMPASTSHFEEPNGRCHDCGIKHGGHHHPGCDVECCPKCGGQLISCGCLGKMEDDDDIYTGEFTPENCDECILPEEDCSPECDLWGKEDSEDDEE